MKSGDFTECKDLKEFYGKIKAFLEKHHGEDYTLNHHALQKYCFGYVKELGVNQGASLANITYNPHVTKVVGIDIHPERFKPYQHLFEQCVKKFNFYMDGSLTKEFEFLGIDSLSPEAYNIKCDVLHIDSKHTSEHLWKELNLHAPNTSRYIIMHDTNKKGLLITIAKFLEENKEWRFIEHETRSVGYVVIEKENINEK